MKVPALIISASSYYFGYYGTGHFYSGSYGMEGVLNTSDWEKRILRLRRFQENGNHVEIDFILFHSKSVFISVETI